ncbi:MAG: ABC transporter permease [Candidatus Solibacter sp.]|nr:ABC transporter permease [Candidatus Solibacter sp.]
MSTFLLDLRYAVRVLRRTPGFAAIVVAVLALGIGANSAVFSVVNAVLLRPLPYHDPDHLYRLDEVNPKGQPAGVSPADAQIFRDRIHAFESVAVSHWQNVTLTGPEGPENTYGGKVSSQCFRMLGRPAALGRTFRDEEFRPGAPAVVILAHKLWKGRFAGDRGVLGKTLLLSGTPHTIIGIMPEDFFYDQRFTLWTPWQFTAGETAKREDRTPAAVRLRPGISPRQAQAELLAALRETAPEDVRKGWSARLVPMAQLLTERVRTSLLVSLGAVAFVLLIACLNVANLLLARVSDRAREIAVRTALGAGRLRMIRQLLTESLLLSVAGGTAGLLVGAWGARALVTLFPDRDPVPRLDQAHLDSAVLLFTLAVTVITGVLFGLAPALQATRANLTVALKESGRGTSSGARSGRVRNSLVIAETALSLILLVGAGLMLRSFQRLMAVNPGFNPDRVLTLRVPLPATITVKAQQPAYYTRILDRLGSLPGLNSAGLIAPLPLADVDANSTFVVEGHLPPNGERQLVKLRAVSPGYFRAMGIGLRQGRVFDDADTRDGSAKVIVVSESLVRRYFPHQNPIGKRITQSTEGKGPFATVVGVVNDVPSLNLADAPEPEMYFDYRQFFFAPFAMTLVLRTHAADPMHVAAAAQKEIRAITPDQPISDVKTMRDVLSGNVSQPRFYTLLLGIYAAIALLLAAIGLYGVLSYAVSQRLQEIGIRLALGASRGHVFRLVMGHALMLLGIGTLLGLAGSWALTRLIAAQLFRTQATDPATFAAVSGLMLAVALAATYVPARRALKVDPAMALRSE